MGLEAQSFSVSLKREMPETAKCYSISSRKLVLC